MSHADLATDLISWWPMGDDPATGKQTDELGRNTLIGTSNLVQVSGRRGNGIQFNSDGTSRLYVPSNGLVQLINRPFTFAGWVKFAALTGSPVILSKTNSSPIATEYRLEYSTFASAVTFRVGSTPLSNQVLAFNSTAPPLNIWHFVIIWLDAPGGFLHIRMNDSNYEGVSVNPMGVNLMESNTLGLYFGSDPDGSNPLNGALNNWGLWGRILTRDEQHILWNDNAGIGYADIAEPECKSIECCDEPLYDHGSSAATDADQNPDSQGEPSPNCPEGYLWGGLSCIRITSPQECSEGWYWDGTKCVEGTDIVCAPGYFNSAGRCVACGIPGLPTFGLVAGQITLTFNVAVAAPYNIFRSTDGVDYEWLTSGVGVGGGDSFIDNTVTPGLTYYYYISVYQSAECGYVDGVVGSVVAI